MERIDHGSVRSSNLGLILRHLRMQGGRSRARIAGGTGLSKATASTLIADLLARGLVTEGEPARDGAVGRPGLTVALDRDRVRGVGIEINADYLALVVVDLLGDVVMETTHAIDIPTRNADEALDEVADLVRPTLRAISAEGRSVVGLCVAAPGTIEAESGQVRFATNLGWRDVAVRAGLCDRLDLRPEMIVVENDAKLGSLAAYAEIARDGIHDLIYVTGDVGVGAGIIADGVLLQGHDGYAGEIGHLPLAPGEGQCPCGRTGCWELSVGLPPFLRRAAATDDPVRDSSRPLEERLGELRERALADDPRTLDALAVTGAALGYGLSLVVDVVNPRALVLGGYFPWFEEWFTRSVDDVLQARMIGHTATPVQVSVSRLGLSAAARGGALLALETVFEDPTAVGPLASPSTSVIDGPAPPRGTP
ncbi:ROK family transcriptional regulator [Flexivirga alba]|uniref:ROK family protein n=1 Tax=Flexivirga alba TaxID=702742 RepID=A0ABW2AHP5_9MICO